VPEAWVRRPGYNREVIRLKHSAEGGQRFASRFPNASRNGFFRQAAGCLISSLGIGTYLGELTDAADAAYTAAVEAAVQGGINVIDTAINYRHQRSERNIGEALRRLIEGGEFSRDELLICSKAGFLTPGAIPEEGLQPEDVVGKMHSMAPDFLEDQIGRSLQNLGVESLDVFYLHNPETQLQFVTKEEFEERVRRAFAQLERLQREGKLNWYGMATWSGFRQKPGAPGRLDLPRLLELAREAGGAEHRFRFIQVPVNLAMPEAFTYPHAELNGDQANLLEVAARAGVTLVASASLKQAQFASGLPAELRAKLAGPRSDAQFAIQFVRSTPGVTTALAGMSSLDHVRENLGVQEFGPAPLEEYLALYRGEA